MHFWFMRYRDDSVEDAGYFEKYLRCSARMTVLHLKRFIVEKTGWHQTLTDQVSLYTVVHVTELSISEISPIKNLLVAIPARATSQLASSTAVQ